MKKLWNVLTRYQVVTWYCHALIATCVGLAFWPLGLNAVRIALWVTAALYLFKEIWDLFCHAADLNDPDFDPEGITPRTDFFGDLVGPLTAAWTAQICYWVAHG